MRVGVSKYVGDPLLNDAVGGLRQQAVEFAEARVDLRGELDLRRLAAGIAKQRLDAFHQAQLVDVKRLQALQNASVRLLQGLDRLNDPSRRGPEPRVWNGIHQGDGVGADPEQQRAQFIMEFAGKLAPIIVLQRYDLAHETAIVLAQLPERSRQF